MIRYHGEEYANLQEIEDGSFWKWWEQTSSINKDNDKVDLCFISDFIYDSSNLKYNFTNDTIWDLKKIVNFIEIQSDYSQVEIVYNQHFNKTMILGNKIKLFQSNTKKKFYLTSYPEIFLKPQDETATSKDMEESELRRYYRSKMANINN